MSIKQTSMSMAMLVAAIIGGIIAVTVLFYP